MGKETVSNHARAIATNGTRHKARTVGNEDTCYNPFAKGKPRKDFPNHIYTEGMVDPGTNTSKTKIDHQIIWIDGGRVGPESDEEHAPYIMGDNTNLPYRGEAWNTTCSGDAFFEGKGCVRTNDATRQNRDNCSGFVDGGEVDGDALTEEDYLKRKCEVISLTGEDNNGRPLGYVGREKEGQPNFIEILHGDTVKLTAARVDTTKIDGAKQQAKTADGLPPSGDVVCRDASHIKWTAKERDDVEEKYATTDYELAGPFNQVNIANYVGVPRNYDKFLPPVRTESDGSIGMDHDRNTPDLTMGEAWASNFIAAYQLWNYRQQAKRVLVRAAGCNNALAANVIVYPSRKIDFTYLYTETTEEAKSVGGIGWVGKVGDLLDKVHVIGAYASKWLGATAQKLDYRMFVNTSLGLNIGFAHCTEEAENNWGDYKSKSHVGLEYEVKISGTLFEASYESKPIPLVALTGVLGPAATYIYDKATGILDRWFGAEVKADIVFSLDATVPVEFTIGQDSNENMTKTGGQTVPEITFKLGVSVVAGVRLLQLDLEVIATMTVGVKFPEKRGSILDFEFGWEVLTRLVVTVGPKDTWLSYTDSFKIEPLSYSSPLKRFPISF